MTILFVDLGIAGEKFILFMFYNSGYVCFHLYYLFDLSASGFIECARFEGDCGTMYIISTNAFVVVAIISRMH